MSDDDKKRPSIPSIEEEFAELDRELKRIASLPVETPEQRNAILAALESFRVHFQESVQARGEMPEWRRILDGAMLRALDGLVVDVQKSTQTTGDFNLDANMVRRHLEPVFDEMTAALRRNLVQKFGQKPPPGAPPVKVDGADLAGILVTLFGPKKK